MDRPIVTSWSIRLTGPIYRARSVVLGGRLLRSDFRALAACFRNVYAERFVRSIKEECLNRVVPLGEGHLRRLVHEYVEHYHRERNHQGRDNQLLERPPPSARRRAAVLRRARLGGLLNFYYREAA